MTIEHAFGKGTQPFHPIALGLFYACTGRRIISIDPRLRAGALLFDCAKVHDFSHTEILPREAAGFKLLGADHVFWLNNTVEGFTIHEAEFDRLFPQGCAVFVGSFGNLGGVIVADLGGEGGY